MHNRLNYNHAFSSFSLIPQYHKLWINCHQSSTSGSYPTISFFGIFFFISRTNGASFYANPWIVLPTKSNNLIFAYNLLTSKSGSPYLQGFPLFSSYSNSQSLVWFRLFKYGYLYHFVLIVHAFSTQYFSFHIFLVPLQYHCIFSLLCAVPVVCRLVCFSQNNILSVCLSTYGYFYNCLSK